MSRPTPICHLTIGPVWRYGNEATNEDLARARYPESGPCIGSACTLWLPDMQHWNKTGQWRGLCSKNRYAFPFSDPAEPGPEVPRV
jgi:hypothetical protein